MDWDIGTARLSIFIGEPANLETTSWWSDVFGLPPDTTEVHRSQAIRIDTGRVDDKTITLRISPLRCDWQLSHLNEGPVPRLESIGSIESTSALFQKWFGTWLERMPTVYRIAVGIQARIATEDRLEAYKVLQAQLPNLDLDPDKSREFLFRINRPRQVKLDDETVTINRLTSWSASRMMMLVQSAVPGAASNVANVDMGIVASCELDLSSDEARTTDFLPAIRLRLLKEFFDNAKEILERGDVQ